MVEYLAQVVLNVINGGNIKCCDIEEWDDGIWNTIDVPQNPDILKDIIADAKKHNLEVYDFGTSIKISENNNTWIRFILYQEDEPNYGNKGDINSLDMTENVYLMAKSLCA